MASKAGIFDSLPLPGHPRVSAALHNGQTSTPGLPVKAAEIIYQGVMVAYDPANSQAQVADPAMPATARVVGINHGPTVDNTDGIKGALKVSPESGIFRVLSDGNLTAAHLRTIVNVVDDHTVGVMAGTDADRPAGELLALEGGYAWVYFAVQTRRAPVTLAADANAAAIVAALVTAGIVAPAD
jgi:hypothetical protein